MNTSKHTLKRNLGSLFIAMVCVSSTALAADTKIYPGQMCVPATQSAAYTIATNTGGIHNPSTTSTLTVNCPLIKDATNDTTISGYSVIVADRSTTEAVKCTLFSRIETTQMEGLSVSTTNADSIVKKLSSGAQPVYADGSLYLRCSIPKQVGTEVSGIVSYRLSEVSN